MSETDSRLFGCFAPCVSPPSKSVMKALSVVYAPGERSVRRFGLSTKSSSTVNKEPVFEVQEEVALSESLLAIQGKGSAFSERAEDCRRDNR